jgi:AGCS family alanine or glycine:cation symporter
LEKFASFWEQAVGIVWGLPLVIALSAAGIYFTLLSRFTPLHPKAWRHAWDLLRGRYDNPDDPGEISHFQALTSAVSGTVGLGNIAGVAIAVGTGGPGAVFWMWVAAVFGMATEFFNCSLACMYRKKDERGIEQGGPMYFLEVGLGPRFKPLAVMFAACGMVGALPLFQSNQLASLLHAEWGIAPLVTGLAAMTVTAIVVLGGVQRLGRVTARLVPGMCLLYLAACGYVIVNHIEQVPGLLLDIAGSAFGFEAAAGGATGLVFKEILITGFKRAAFSNEAGIGTTALAHGAARTREPIRQGLVAMLGPFIDTHIVCTATALVILISGVPHDTSGIVMTTSAFNESMPRFGGVLLSAGVVLFAVSTIITYAYYSEKCARYLFGYRLGHYFGYLYVALIPVAAMWSQGIAVNVIDTAFALMAIPTLTGVVLLAPKVVEAQKDYFRRMGL